MTAPLKPEDRERARPTRGQVVGQLARSLVNVIAGLRRNGMSLDNPDHFRGWIESKLVEREAAVMAEALEQAVECAPSWGPFNMENRPNNVSTPETRAYWLGVEDVRRSIRALAAAPAEEQPK